LGTVIAPLWILRSGANLANESCRNQTCKPRSRGTWSKTDDRRYFTGEQTPSGSQCIHDRLICLVQLWTASPAHEQGDAETQCDLFESGWCQSQFEAGGLHALYAASPLLDQSECVEHPTDDAIAEFRNALRKIFDGKAERQQAGIFDLEPVIEDRNANWGAALCVMARIG
jgi:hypothetical protein